MAVVRRPGVIYCLHPRPLPVRIPPDHPRSPAARNSLGRDLGVSIPATPPTPIPMLQLARPRALTFPPFPGNIWHAPLVPFALAVTAGIVLDRYVGIPLAF